MRVSGKHLMKQEGIECRMLAMGRLAEMKQKRQSKEE
jgi:hypothetical protein